MGGLLKTIQVVSRFSEKNMIVHYMATLKLPQVLIKIEYYVVVYKYAVVLSP